MDHARLSLSVCFISAVFTSAACQSDGAEDDQERLLALLRDEPLALPAGASAAAREGGAAAAAADAPRHIILPTVNPLGVWEFEDCTPTRTQLTDASGKGNTAYRAVPVACADGIRSSRGVAIAAPEDIIYVPDQPSFEFDDGVTVAGWFKPSVVGGSRTLFRRRDKGTSSFALMLNAGKFEFVVNLGNNTAISVLSPARAKAGVYQHVAATYDGATARLYVDGLEVNSFAAPGEIPLGPGPLLMGNDGSERRFAGSLDAALFTTHALTADEVRALTCFPVQPTVAVTPQTLSSPPGAPVALDVAVTNHNPAACAPITFSVQALSFDSRLAVAPAQSSSAPVPSGQTGHLTVTATPAATVEPGTNLSLDLRITEPLSGLFSFQFRTLTVAEPAGCFVRTARELMIKHTSVVDDPVRTAFDPTSGDPRSGVWTFKHLMENIAPTEAEAPAMVEAMLQTFTTPQTINGSSIAARPGMQSLILDSWPRTADGGLDLAQAPLRLQAIVNRVDLRDLASGDAGEARFVFAFHSPLSFFPLEATLIVEYKLPAATEADVLDWAQAFHGLGAHAFGESYNAALQAVTERFVARGARPGHPNGSALATVRTNELDLGNSFVWELREFRLSAATGMLAPSPLDRTPSRTFSGTQTLASYISQNQTAILADKHTVPLSFNGQPFQAGAVLNDFSSVWTAPGANSEARFHFAINTCDGCHRAETGAPFQHISPRFSGSEAGLSGFLTGTTIFDPTTGQSRPVNDLARRKADLESLVCAEPAALAGAANVRRGASRVH